MRIRKLLQELCPDGIEYVSLNKVIDYIQPTRFIVDSTDYKSYGIPVLTAGKTFLLGYTDEVDCVFRSNADNPVMIFDDFTTSMHWVDFDFKVKSSALKILVLKGQDAILRYLYYSIKSLDYSMSESTHERHWISKYSRLEIPLPPLPIQEEIVRILDEFTELEVELEAELEARTKQYEYYRKQLLDFSTGIVGFPHIDKMLNEFCPDGVNYVCLDNVIDYIQPTKFIVKSTEYKLFGTPVLTAGKTFLLGYTDEIEGIFNSNHEYPVMIFDDFTTSMHWVDFDFKVKSSALKILVIKGDNAILRYLYYSLKTINYPKSESTHERHWISKYSKLEIALPPLPIQAEIVRILDQFSEYTSSISQGLPAEIELRRKQYEYYRNKLLTF